MNSSQWKRLVGESCPDIYNPVHLDAVDGSKICFYTASVTKLLQYVVSTCGNYAKEIQKCLDQKPSMCFEMIVYNDEAQAGNLLSVDSDKKASLWYFCLREVGWRWSDVVWHPICLIQHNDIEQVRGGFSAVARLIIRAILNEDLHLGFPFFLPNNRTTLLKCDVKWMISDLDSVRAALSLKGSAAIRCCLFCKNAMKKHSNSEGIGDFFQDITSENVDGFHEQSDAGIFQLWDYLAEQKRILRKRAMQKKEQAAGFNYSDAAWLDDRTVREAVLPWCFLLDSMRMYWSNGVVSWEVNAIYHLWKEQKVGNLLEFMSLDWKTSSGQSNTLSWRKKISNEANFSAAAYRGDSSNLQCFFPLFHHFIEGCLWPQGLCTDAIQSMRALRRITIELRKNHARRRNQPEAFPAASNLTSFFGQGCIWL